MARKFTPGQFSFCFFKHGKGKSLFHHAMFRLLLHVPSSYANVFSWHFSDLAKCPT